MADIARLTSTVKKAKQKLARAKAHYNASYEAYRTANTAVHGARSELEAAQKALLEAI